MRTLFLLLPALLLFACDDKMKEEAPPLDLTVLETSAAGRKLDTLTTFGTTGDTVLVTLRPGETYQTITGIGGSFTEASAHLLNRLGAENRQRILEAYFGDEGARYSLTRTHINSCDFSLGNYSYAPVAGDTALNSFSIEEDRPDLIPMIKDALAISTDGFRIISSPWTAPPWMKDNQDWRGGKLLPEYYDTWARFFARYLAAYRAEGIDIWGITVENEPLGNDRNWESMHFSPEEMTAFVRDHLGPTLEKEWSAVNILGYDQNRGEEMKDWVDAQYNDPAAARYFDGTAVHWYASTVEYFPEMLTYAHEAAPDKYLIQTEGCVDAEVPHWRDDEWYWSKEATDWGWDWAPPEQKHLHPKYVPVYRYARDMIGCLNNYVDGWIDWNMVLDRRGGPNWFGNWCTAPVIVDPEADEVYFTPLYYTMAHFSKYIRPGAVRIGFESSNEGLQVTAVRNPDGSTVAVLLNETEVEQTYQLQLGGRSRLLSISPRALQTVVITS